MKLTRFKFKVMELAMKKIGTERIYIFKTDDDFFNADVALTFGINCAATGTLTYSEAVEFADHVKEIAEACNFINGLKISGICLPDAHPYNDKDLKKEVHKAVEVIKSLDYGKFEDWSNN